MNPIQTKENTPFDILKKMPGKANQNIALQEPMKITIRISL